MSGTGYEDDITRQRADRGDVGERELGVAEQRAGRDHQCDVAGRVAHRAAVDSHEVRSAPVSSRATVAGIRIGARRATTASRASAAVGTGTGARTTAAGTGVRCAAAVTHSRGAAAAAVTSLVGADGRRGVIAAAG